MNYVYFKILIGTQKSIQGAYRQRLPVPALYSLQCVLNDMTHGVGTVNYYIYSFGKMFSKARMRQLVNMAWHMNQIFFCHFNVFNIVLCLIVMLCI
jgi:hypothetical protein